MPPPDPAGPTPREAQDAAALLALLAAPVRLQLLWLLERSDSDVGTLSEHVGQSVAAVSHHLGKLRLAGLVRARREGKRQIYRLDDPRVGPILRLAVTAPERDRQRSRRSG